MKKIKTIEKLVEQALAELNCWLLTGWHPDEEWFCSLGDAVSKTDAASLAKLAVLQTGELREGFRGFELDLPSKKAVLAHIARNGGLKKIPTTLAITAWAENGDGETVTVDLAEADEVLAQNKVWANLWRQICFCRGARDERALREYKLPRAMA